MQLSRRRPLEPAPSPNQEALLPKGTGSRVPLSQLARFHKPAPWNRSLTASSSHRGAARFASGKLYSTTMTHSLVAPACQVPPAPQCCAPKSARIRSGGWKVGEPGYVRARVYGRAPQNRHHTCRSEQSQCGLNVRTLNRLCERVRCVVTWASSGSSGASAVPNKQRLEFGSQHPWRSLCERSAMSFGKSRRGRADTA
jgi:hypothetical protein